MKTLFRCGHQFDDGIADGKTKRDPRYCLDCVGEGKDDAEQTALDWE